MGVPTSKFLRCYKNQRSKTEWMIQLQTMSPEELLTYVMAYPEVYQVCENETTLRQACILAAVRRYDKEKLVEPAVCDRTAPYMVMLDNFLQVEDAIQLN